LVEVGQEVAGCLGGPGCGRVRGDAEDVDASGGDLHDEQDVESAQADGVEVEEVGGQQPCRLGAQEGSPLGVGPSRRGAATASGERSPSKCSHDTNSDRP
jgi:hypothetical protein